MLGVALEQHHSFMLSFVQVITIDTCVMLCVGGMPTSNAAMVSVMLPEI
jgi:acid phosphatase family membrane protein YuiD